jgi:hypothetical protein
MRPRRRGSSGSAGTATAWQVEAEHHGAAIRPARLCPRARGRLRPRPAQRGENGTRKFGIDARARLGEKWSLTAAPGTRIIWRATPAASPAARSRISRSRAFRAALGLTFADDRLADGREARSTILQLGATKRLLDNKLELDAQTEIPIGGKARASTSPPATASAPAMR